MFRWKKDGLNEKVEGFLEKGHLTKNFNRFLALAVTYMFGPSASAVEAYGFMLVCMCVRHSISRKPYIRFWWYYILMSLKNVLSGFLKKFSFDPQGEFWPQKNFLVPAERLGPIKSCSFFHAYVRPVEISKSVHRIVLIFGTKLQLDNRKKVFFLKKNLNPADYRGLV